MDDHDAHQQQVREQATASSSPPRPPPKSAVPTSTRRNPILRAALDPLSSLVASTTPPDAFAVSETALDLLLIEMVTVTVRTARRRRLRERRVLQRLMAAAAVVGGNADGSDADDLSSDCDDDDDDRGGSGGAGDGNEEVVDAGALMDAFMLQATVSGTSSGGVGQAPVPSSLFGPNGNVANGATVDREAVFHKLESMGYAVGQRLMERCVCVCDSARTACVCACCARLVF